MLYVKLEKGFKTKSAVSSYIGELYTADMFMYNGTAHIKTKAGTVVNLHTGEISFLSRFTPVVEIKEATITGYVTT